MTMATVGKKRSRLYDLLSAAPLSGLCGSSDTDQGGPLIPSFLLTEPGRPRKRPGKSHSVLFLVKMSHETYFKMKSTLNEI